MADDLTPAERALLRVYRDAERALLGEVVRGTRRVVDADGDHGVRRDAHRQIERAAAEVAADLERGNDSRVRAVIDDGGERGQARAAAELRAAGIPPRDQYDDRVNRGALDRLAASTVDRTSQAHASILRTTPDAFRAVTARVLPGSIVGTETRRQAAQRALWALTDRGITGFTDRAGRNWRLSSYVEMATRTAHARAMVDGQLDRLSGAGHDLVYVQGMNGCPRCAPYIGGVLTITHSGPAPTPRRRGLPSPVASRTSVLSMTSDDQINVDILGSVDSARADGWGHPHCRCTLSMYIPGATDLAQDSGQAYDPDTAAEAYQDEQRQRALERRIRGWKDREAGALDDDALGYARRGTRAAQADMREFLDAHPDHLRYPHRERANVEAR